MDTRYLIDTIKPAWIKATNDKPSFLFFYHLLCLRYGHSVRKYHTFEHLEKCFREYDTYLTDTGDVRSLALDLSITCHDLVYNPLSQSNESDSSTLMKNLFYLFNVEQTLVKEVERIIWITSTYGRETPPPLDSLTLEQKLMSDLDLSGLGLSWEGFLRNNDLVDEEFSVVPLEIYHPNRIKFLTLLTRRRRLFLTDYFQQKYEDIAKDNLGKYLKQLIGQ